MNPPIARIHAFARVCVGITTCLVLAPHVFARADAAPMQPSGTAVAVVEQPRSAGYFVGDLVTQRVLLESAGRVVSPLRLPASGRVNAWLERRKVSIETDPSSRRWLVVQYQILNAPPKLIRVTLPGWVLATALNVPATSINISPLSLPGSPAQVGVADLRPDRLPPPIPTSPIRHAIVLSAGALVLTLAAWLCWIAWRTRRAIATQPFARALRELRALSDDEPQAWQVLHRAFDRVAGCVIQNSTLPELFARAPQLAPARAKIERFFAQSGFMFFATSPHHLAQPYAAVESQPESLGASSAALPGEALQSSLAVKPRALCAELRRIERRHER